MRPYVLAETNYGDAKELDYQVAVLPIGATEPHNLHLPYGADALATAKISELACERAWQAGARVCCLPTIPFGVNTNQLEFPMVVNMNPSTQLAVIRDVVDSAARCGPKKLVLLNGHGGNELSWILRELHGGPVFLALVNWYTVASDEAGPIFSKGGEHADEMETSVALHLYPELVAPLDQADDGKVKPCRLRAVEQGWAKIARPWHLLTKNSGYGDPHGATAEKGRQYLDVVLRRISDFLVELANAEKDEQFPY
jgi:creatinine amidohydrolase